MFNCIHSAGRNYKILGYVNTAGGSRASNYVTGGGDGQAYITQWYNTYGGYIDGIFLDVGPARGSGTTLQSYYQGLHTSIVGHSGPCASSKACVMLNASQFEQDWVLSSSVANYVVTWEKPVGAGTNQYYLATGTTGFIPAAASQSPTGWYTDPAKVGSTSHLIYGVSDSVYSIASIVCKSQSAYGGPMLYVYDGTSSGYNHLPSYFETLAGNALNCPAQAQLPCGDGSTDSCGNNCGFGTYCTPGTGYCQDLGGYYGCQ